MSTLNQAMTSYFRGTVQNVFVIEKIVSIRNLFYPFNSITCFSSFVHLHSLTLVSFITLALHHYPLFELQWVPFSIHLQISTPTPKTLPTLLQHISLPQALPRLKMIVAKFLPYSSPSRFDLQLSVTVSLSLQCVNIPLQGPDLKLVN